MENIRSLPFEDELKAEMDSLCRIITVEKSNSIVRSGDYMKNIPLILEGSVRVFRRDYDSDRELLLYYTGPGETCMMSLVACFGDNISQVNAVTEKTSQILLIPAPQVRAWQIKYNTWNRFVIETFLNRYTELLEALDEVSFKNIDERLHNYLKDYANRHVTRSVKLTHQQIANELGTTRVVISRSLKNMEEVGLLKLKRGLIKLKNL